MTAYGCVKLSGKGEYLEHKTRNCAGGILVKLIERIVKAQAILDEASNTWEEKRVALRDARELVDKLEEEKKVAYHKEMAAKIVYDHLTRIMARLGPDYAGEDVFEGLPKTDGEAAVALIFPGFFETAGR